MTTLEFIGSGIHEKVEVRKAPTETIILRGGKAFVRGGSVEIKLGARRLETITYQQETFRRMRRPKSSDIKVVP